MERRLYMMKENKWPGNIYFKYVGDITEDGAMIMQERAGYHPYGYGFYGFVRVRGIARWHCANSCE
jgi:hypothetical protein